MLNKYAQVYQLTQRLTDDPSFRTFFTLYLMADSDEARLLLETQFWQDVEQLDPSEQELLRAECTRCFLKLPALAAQLLERVVPVST